MSAIADPDRPPVTRYDDFLYDENPVTESHPSHVGAIAWLMGIRAVPPTRCRVLELGCALGANLIPMAAYLPESTFVGIDLSGQQIAHAQRRAEEAGLRNIRFEAADILDLTPDIGTFDYILCHGVYSWVPIPVQKKILEICGACLSPNGLAYVSFNTYPGWHLRGGLRDMLRRAVGPKGTPQERVARAREYLKFLDHLPNGHVAQVWFRGELLEIMKQVSDQYIFYEHLVDINIPSYFEDFSRDAREAGLNYVGDGHVPSMFAERFGPEALEALNARSDDPYECEQNLDLLEIRYFRRAIMCRKELEPERNVEWHRLDGLWISSLMEPLSKEVDYKSDKVEKFKRSDKIEMETSTPLLKAAFKVLWQERPRGLSFREVCSMARALLGDPTIREPTIEDMRVLGVNFAALCLRGHLEASLWTPPYVLSPGEKPATTPLIRYQASSDFRTCTNLRHESVRMDRFDRCMLARLDGKHTWDELIDGVIEDAKAGKVSVESEGKPVFDREILAEVFEQKLSAMGRKAILLR